MSIGHFQEFSKTYKHIIEEALFTSLKQLSAPKRLVEAMDYSLQAGGKRLRPLLLFATLHGFKKDPKIGLPIALSLEMVHTYSLVHDDLPSMDNDDLRRGKPTNHKVFGEAYAILAGDALLTYSFQTIAEVNDNEISTEKKLKLILELSKAAGPEGMVGGQVADLEGEKKSLTLQDLEYIHERKTGKLLEYSIIAGGIIADATEEQIQHLRDFAFHLGLAFQIRDDILDIEGTVEEIGKPVGSDEHNEKSTYPSVLTLDGAKEKLEEHILLAKKSLSLTNNMDSSFLLEICNLIAERKN